MSSFARKAAVGMLLLGVTCAVHANVLRAGVCQANTTPSLGTGLAEIAIGKLRSHTDAAGRIAGRTYPGGFAFTTNFDGEGNARSETHPNGVAITRIFDGLNRETSSVFSAGSTGAPSISTVNIYDGDGNLTHRTESTGSSSVEITRTYDDQNRLETESSRTSGPAPLTGAVGTQRYGYDAAGNRTSQVDARGTQTLHTFDAANHLIGISNAEGTTTQSWNLDGTLSTIQQGNGNSISYLYDRVQRIEHVVHRNAGAVAVGFDYTYDDNGNRLTEVRTDAPLGALPGKVVTTTYNYDADDRLTSASPSGGSPAAVYTLDEVGNRKTETLTDPAHGDHVRTYDYNARDQLTHFADAAKQLQVDYAYDSNGNRTQRTVTRGPTGATTVAVTGYAFDPRDRLTGVQPNAPNAANEPDVNYGYDGDDRRIARIVTPAANGSPTTTLYTYDGSTLLHEAVPNGATPAITATYRHSAKLDRHIDFGPTGTSDPVVRYYALDSLDTPVALSEATGATTARTSYDAWGITKEQTADGVTVTPDHSDAAQAALPGNDGQSIGFTGYQKDDAAGLYYAGARFYDPLVGAFDSMDPASGDPLRPLSYNKYLYAYGNPTRYTDPTGRCPECAWAFQYEYAETEHERSIALQSAAPVLAATAGAFAGAAEPGLSASRWIVDFAISAPGSVEERNLAGAPLRLARGLGKAAADFAWSEGPYDYLRSGTTNALERIHNAGAEGDYFGQYKGGVELAVSYGAPVAAAPTIARVATRMAARSAVEAGGVVTTTEATGEPGVVGQITNQVIEQNIVQQEVVAAQAPALSGKTIYVDSRGNAVVSASALPTNYRGQNMIIPQGHMPGRLDPPLSSPPIVEPGPFTAAQRQAFLRGQSGSTGLEAHHRGQLPTAYGSVIDDLPGPAHPSGNQHTVSGRHPNKSIFNQSEGGSSWRSSENRAHYKAKGERLVLDEETGEYFDPGPQQ